MNSCPCGKAADTLCTLYKGYKVKEMCFDCAFRWLWESSTCPNCGGAPKSCSEKCKYHGALDRGITPAL